MTNVINIKNFTKDYGMNRGVFNINLTIQKGEVYGFLGPNGAGKSTTIRHLMGFSKPDSGKCQILGLDSFNNYYKLLDKVGYLPGEVALPEGLTGNEFLKMMRELRKVKDATREKELLKMFDLDPSGNTKSMSLGQKRKLAIVTAFMHDPEILILDEPTSGLDPLMQEKFIEFIKEEKERGKTILLSSHIFSEVDATCDKIAIIKDGKIVDKFVTNDLKHNSTKIFQLFFDNVGDFVRFSSDIAQEKYLELVVSDSENNKCLIRVNDNKINNTINFLSKYHIKKMIENKITLQDYFMKFYKEDIKYEEV